MLTDEDIKKLTTVFATREEMDVKFEAMHLSFSELQSAVDAYAKKADTYFQEMVALAHRVDRHEKWIQQIAEKLGVKLEF